VHVDCTAYGLGANPPRPIFEAHRITPRSRMGGFVTFNAAIVGIVEAMRDDDIEKNRLRPPSYPRPGDRLDQRVRGASRSWRGCSRSRTSPSGCSPAELNTTRGMNVHNDDPGMQAALGRWFEHIEPALSNAGRLRTAAAA
jgi:hypothetical protein